MDRISALLDLMGNPEKGIKAVHVGGTNGKGSTCWITASILKEAGYRVGCFLSPHIWSYRERFTIDGEMIPASDLERCLDEVLVFADQMVRQGMHHPTEFEILTALAFKYFADQKVDVAVIEVGMGGRYDSTNVIKPLVAIITSIDIDHVAYLGETLEEIAYNKAGIIKPAVPVVLGPLPPPAREVMKEQARLLKAPVFNNSLVCIHPADGFLNISLPGFDLTRISFPLTGEFQLDNLACALTALHLLHEQGFPVKAADIARALKHLYFPGRMQIISRNPLIIADAAHNPHGARALNASLLRLWPERSRVLVVGMLDDKDACEALKELACNARACIVTRPDRERSGEWRRLSGLGKSLYPGLEIIEEEDPRQALATGLGILKANEYMLISGSFYLLGKIWSVLETYL